MTVSHEEIQIALPSIVLPNDYVLAENTFVVTNHIGSETSIVVDTHHNSTNNILLFDTKIGPGKLIAIGDHPDTELVFRVIKNIGDARMVVIGIKPYRSPLNISVQPLSRILNQLLIWQLRRFHQLRERIPKDVFILAIVKPMLQFV